MNEIFLQYFDDIYRYVSRRVGDKNQIHTIVRNTFLDAVKYMEKVQDDLPHTALTNLYKIAYNHILILPQARPHLFGPKSASIQKALDFLDPEDREIVRLKFWEDVTDRDIATIVGLNPRRIDVRVLQAIKRFKENWQDSAEYPEAQYFSSIASAFTTAKVEQAIMADSALRESLHDELEALHTESEILYRSPLATFAKIIWLIRIPVILGVLLVLAYQFNVFENIKNLLSPTGEQTQVAENNNIPQDDGKKSETEGTTNIEVFSGTGKYKEPLKQNEQNTVKETDEKSSEALNEGAGQKTNMPKKPSTGSVEKVIKPENPAPLVAEQAQPSPKISPLDIQATVITFPGKYVAPPIAPVSTTSPVTQDVYQTVLLYCFDGAEVRLTPQCYTELKNIGITQKDLQITVIKKQTGGTVNYYRTYEVIPGMTARGTTFTMPEGMDT